MSGNHRCRVPSEKQRAILRLLAESDRPMRSADLQRRAGLLTGEFRGALYWLRDNGYIVGVVKRIKTFGIGLTMNRKAFWTLLPKGRESLDQSVQSVTAPQQHSTATECALHPSE